MRGSFKKNSWLLLAVIYDAGQGKAYRLPTLEETTILEQLPKEELESYRPTESMQRNSAGGDTFTCGVRQWGQMFSLRQLLALKTLVSKFHQIQKEYSL